MLSSFQDKVQVFNNFITKKKCKEWIKKANKSYNKNELFEIQNYTAGHFEKRTVDISKDPIVKKISEKFGGNLVIDEAQLQTWPVGSVSKLHIHNLDDRKITKMNSIIYLNDDFEGGLFHTYWGVVIKPKTGMLTHFDGSTVWHGVSEVKKKDRFTLIFWWKNL